MSDVMKKIITSAISEVVEALIFGICLYIALTLPDDSVRQSIVNSIVILWVVAGIGTPIIIFVDLKEMLSDIFNENSGRN